MKEYIITEEELNTLMIAWRIPTPAGYTSERMSSIEKAIRAREKPQTVKELQEVLEHFGMRIGIESIKERESTVYVHASKIPPTGTGEAVATSYNLMVEMQKLKDEVKKFNKVKEKFNELSKCLKKHWGQTHESPLYQYNKLVKTLDDFEKLMR